MIRKTKIICTIGPATEDPMVLRELILSGMDVARLNFSHGNLELFGKWIRLIRSEAKALARTVAILQDLPGPKIRTGPIKDVEVVLIKGSRFLLRTGPDEGSNKSVQISYGKLPQEVSAGDPIFIDDGRIRLKVIRSTRFEIETEVVGGGKLRGECGINVPESALSISSISDRDLEFLEFGLARGVDWVALSFVKSAEDINQVRAHCRAAGKNPRIIAKIERREALHRLEEIVMASDAVMVARGDLGIEIPVEQVPMAQKTIIDLANRKGKPVVTATQMLESMVENPWPTRAEVADIANAVLDGTDALMLSEETSIGKFPLEAVRIMARASREVEDRVQTNHAGGLFEASGEDVSGAVVHGACLIAAEIQAGVIAAVTRTGRTAERFSAARPNLPIVAVVSDEEIGRQLVLRRGVIPLAVDRLDEIDQAPEILFKQLCAKGWTRPGDRIILTGGIPSGGPGSTSFVRVLQIPGAMER
ncbi:MAG: pyruvate kinase [Nitrospiria bacterium]